jgi:hypothetical protein
VNIIKEEKDARIVNETIVVVKIYVMIIIKEKNNVEIVVVAVFVNTIKSNTVVLFVVQFFVNMEGASIDVMIILVQVVKFVIIIAEKVNANIVEVVLYVSMKK